MIEAGVDGPIIATTRTGCDRAGATRKTPMRFFFFVCCSFALFRANAGRGRLYFPRPNPIRLRWSGYPAGAARGDFPHRAPHSPADELSEGIGRGGEIVDNRPGAAGGKPSPNESGGGGKAARPG